MAKGITDKYMNKKRADESGKSGMDGGRGRHSVIESKIREFLVESLLFGDSSVSLTATDSLHKLGLIDSTTIVELVTFIEQEFGVRVEEADLIPENFESIAGLVEFVSQRYERKD